jgi:hypothetical protein
MSEVLDVLVISASRPHLLYLTLHSWNTHATGVRLRFYIQDDPAVPSLSKLITREQLNQPLPVKQLDIAEITCEAKCVGPFVKYARFACDARRTEYFLILEDDFILPKPLDVAAMLAVMRHRPDVSELIVPYKNHAVSATEESGVPGVNITLNKTPLASPGLWRTSVLASASKHPLVAPMLKQNFNTLRIPIFFPNYYKKVHEMQNDRPALVAYLREHVGAYMLRDKHARVVHIGGCCRRFEPEHHTSEADIVHELFSARWFSALDPADPIPILPIPGSLNCGDTAIIDKEYALVKDPRRRYGYLRRLLEHSNVFAPKHRNKMVAHVKFLLQEAELVPERHDVVFKHYSVPAALTPK